MADPFVAEIRIFPFNFAPRGWAWCDGQLLPLSQNTALFSLLGTTYGGNGKSNFALPDLQGRAPMHPGQGPGLSLHDLGETGGSETVTLLQSEIPVHTHAVQANAGAGDLQGPSDQRSLARSSGGTAYQSSVNANLVPMAPEALPPAGGSQPHNNMQPYLTMYFNIALQGVFPLVADPSHHLTRRRLVQAGGGALALLALGPLGAARASGDALRRATWRPLVGQAVVLDERGVARVEAVTDLVRAAGDAALRGHEEHFTVLLDGPAGAASGTHALRHPSMGDVELFLSPVGRPEGSRQRYEIVVDRLTIRGGPEPAAPPAAAPPAAAEAAPASAPAPAPAAAGPVAAAAALVRRARRRRKPRRKLRKKKLRLRVKRRKRPVRRKR